MLADAHPINMPDSMKMQAFLSACTPALAVIFAVALVGQPVRAAEASRVILNTLFYTPAQRQQISHARQPDTGAEAPSTMRLSGVVRRSGRKGTVWINSKALPEGDTNTPHLTGMDAVVDGQRLRVGESLDTVSGVRSDLVAPGSVTVRAPK